MPNRKSNALATSAYAISMVGDITPGVIRKLLESGTEAFDGAANRYLWAAVRSPRSLPMGGNIKVLLPYLDRLKAALAFAKQAGEVKQDADAERLWAEVYPSLKTSGDSVPHTDRARPYALRLAMLYALAADSKVIRPEHLHAALALWSYCRASAKMIFCEIQTTPVEPDPLWLRLLNAITSTPGINRSGLREVAGHKIPVEEIDAALGSLKAQGLVYSKMVQSGGRPAECWYPVVGPDGDGEGGSVLNDNPASSLSPKEAQGVGKEGNNSPPSASAGNLGREGSKPSEQEGTDYLSEWYTDEVSSLPPAQPTQGKREGVGRKDNSLPPCPEAKESTDGVVIRPHYPTVKAWVDAVYQAGGKILKDEDDSCTLWLHEKLDAERSKLLEDDAEFWLAEACDEAMTEVDFLAELMAM